MKEEPVVFFPIAVGIKTPPLPTRSSEAPTGVGGGGCEVIRECSNEIEGQAFPVFARWGPSEHLPTRQVSIFSLSLFLSLPPFLPFFLEKQSHKFCYLHTRPEEFTVLFSSASPIYLCRSHHTVRFLEGYSNHQLGGVGHENYFSVLQLLTTKTTPKI